MDARRKSVAAETLAKAHFFLDHVARTDPLERKAFTNYFEAAIIFARSVTFHLQSEYSRRPGFEEWYAEQQQRLRSDRLSRFLLEQRNYVLKQGPVSIRRRVEMELFVSLNLTDSVSVDVVRGKPWYRQSPKLLFEDAIYPLRQRLHGWRQRLAARQAARAQHRSGSRLVRDTFFFDEPEWNATPAIELLTRQLSTLDAIVVNAETLFSQDDKPANGDVAA